MNKIYFMEQDIKDDAVNKTAYVTGDVVAVQSKYDNHWYYFHKIDGQYRMVMYSQRYINLEEN